MMAIHPMLPVLVAASLAGLLLPDRRGRRPAPAGIAWAALGLAATALLWPALRLPDGVPSPAALLAKHPPWQAAGPTAPADSPAALSDVAYQIEPWLIHLRRELRAGRAPFWNPYQYAGAPFWSNGQSAPLFPLHLLFAALPLGAGLVLLPWLKVMVAGLGARALARQLGTSEGAALLAGLTFALSGMLAGFVLYPMGNALALVPWVLWAVERLAAGRSGPLPLAVASGLQLLAGHPETALHTALLSGIYLVVRGSGVQRCVRGASLPTDAGPEEACEGRSSWRGSIPLWCGWAAGWTLGAGLAAVQLVPLALELAASARWQAAGAGFTEPLGRLLAQPLRLALPELYGDPARGTWFGPYNYLATAAYAGALALPLAAVGTGWIREPRRDRRWLAVAALLAFSFAAAYHLPGVRQALEALPVLGRAAHHRLIFGVELALALFAAAGFDRWRAGRGGRALLAGGAAVALALAAAWWLLGGEWAARGLTPRQLAWSAAAAAAVLLLAAGRRLAPRPRRALALALPALAAADLLAAHGAINPGLPLDRLFPETAAVHFLQGREGRVAGAGDALRPNAAMVYRLHDVRGDDTVKSARWARFEAEHLGAGHPNYFTPIRRWDPLWLDRLGVRWVIAAPGEPPPAGGWRLAFDGADARVWERPAALPPVRWTGAAEDGRRVEVVEQASGRWRLRWASPRRGLLVVADSFDPGWSARVVSGGGAAPGGGRVPVRAAGGVLIGLELGPGEGEVELVYRPRGIGWGAAASLAAILIVAGLAWRRRRQVEVAAGEDRR